LAVADRTIGEVKQAAAFCDEHGEFSQLPTKPILTLIRIKDKQIQERAIIKCKERLNGKIGAGRGNTKELTEKANRQPSPRTADEKYGTLPVSIPYPLFLIHNRTGCIVYLA
jgi:hypothetical protein